MVKYLLRRLLLILPTVWIAVTIIFVIFRLVPGDPAELIAGEMAPREVVQAIRAQMGLDQPMHIQYVRYLGGLLRGDLGVSKVYGARVLDQLLLRFPATLELAIAAMLIAFIVGLTAGIISATRYNSLFDYLSMLGAIAGVCVPAFWLGLMLILFFSVGLGWLPSTGRGGLRTLVLPAVTLSAYQMAVIARMTRSSMLEVIQQDYIRTARAKGLAEWAVIYGHALKNALIPTITIAGLQFGFLLGGSIVVESVFAWPGLGSLMIDSIRHRDYTMVQGTAVLYTTVCLLINLLVDLVYSALDPRVRYG